MVFADDGAAFGPALAPSPTSSRRRRRPRARRPARSRSADLEATEPPADVERAFAALGPGHGREDPVHVGLDRHAEGRDQHPPDAVLQPAGARPGLAVPGRRAAGARRLAAVEPHVRRQPQPQPGARVRRHAAHRRRQAGAGALRPDGRGAARRRPDRLLQRPRRLRAARAAPRGRPRARARRSSRGCASCSTPPRRCRRRSGTACARSPTRSPDHEVPLTASWGTTETAPGATTAHFAVGAVRVHRRPAARA